MSDFQFSLELVEKISGPADTAKTHLEKMRSSAKEAGKALDYGDKAKRAAEELARIKLDPKGFIAAHEAMKKLREEQAKLVRQAELSGGFKKLFSWVTPYGFGRLGSNILGNLASDAIEKIPESLMAGAEKAVDILREGISKAFEVGGKEEHLRGSFKYLFGGSEGARAALEEADRFSKLLPFGGQKTAGYIGDLGKAGITGQAAASSLALAADVGAMSPSGEGTDEALFALERLKRHGEFSNRLAEGLNINLTDLYAAIGKKLHVSADEAQKKLGQPGKVGFNTILNTMMELHSRSIGAPTGSVALEQSKELMQRWARIKELPEEYLRSISSAPGWNRLSDTLGRVLDQLDPNKHPEIVNGLLDAFNQLAGKASAILTPDNVRAFSDALVNLPETLRSIGNGLDTVLKVSEAIGVVWAGSKIVSGINAAAMALPALGTAAGATAAGVGALAAPILAISAAIASVTFAIKEWHDVITSYEEVKQYEKDYGITDEMKAKTPEQWKAELAELKATRDRARAERGFAPIGHQGSPAVAGGAVHINVPKIEVNIAGGDAGSTGHQVGVEVHRAASQALERAAQEAGAS